MDSTAETSTLQNRLELELFPSGQPSSSTSRSNRPQPPSSFDFQGAAQNEPWSQAEFKATPYVRDEWLISVGQKRPTDLVEDFIQIDGQAGAAQPPRPRPRVVASGSDTTTSLASAWKARAQSDASTAPNTKRSRSSLLDQLDAICSSPSQQFSSSPQEDVHKSTPETPAAQHRPPDRRPLKPLSNIHPNEKAPAAQAKANNPNPIDVVDVSSSPPSQAGQQHITLISDMPQELRDIYHRLAFGGRSSSSQSSTPQNAGVTARGTRGKTWQTTWQDDEGEAAQGAVGTSSRASSSRGRKPTSSTSTARGGTRASKTRSSSATSSTAKSRFFAARGGFRGRGRARWRGRGR
ncbi:hypothetical protein PSEUBRA_001209 [Kalmanozyma brasiliensis GHG001]|uniref:uncharacterized protein n=1 Tax=Kalmanozyma brasiliensis (strain GHG001) TaxID=1365824 RepID=UPI002867ED7E|nr:uncharacterized protein PSEUBRA_001209 [Kalmanozyma brasiliensis GHG001]KAF6766903.1 hypothetical protein PSEUBRA_001209 [Kalmanozyma brasiliensis GHG001]